MRITEPINKGILSKILYSGNWIVWFQCGCNTEATELCVKRFVLNNVISNWFWAVHSFVFEITIDCSSKCTPISSMIIIKTADIFNFHCVGLQPNSDPPTWVIGSHLHVHLVEGVATRLQESLSPYAVLGSELAPLPIINIKGLHLSKICMHHLDRKLSPTSVYL